MKKRFLLIMALLLVCLCASLLLAGCQGGTETAESGTQADGTVGSEPADDTLPGAGTGTAAPETAPDTETETETEAETEAPALKVITFPADIAVSDYFSTTGLDASLNTDGDVPYIALTMTGARARMTLDCGAYAKAAGLTNADAGLVNYLVFTFRVDSGNEGTLRVDSVTSEGGRAALDQQAWYDADGERWQTAAFNISQGKKSGGMEKIVFDFTADYVKKGDTFGLREIALCADLNEAVSLCGHPEYALAELVAGAVADDPLRHDALTAPDEDASVKLWFDHITEKVLQADFTPTDRVGYTIYMGRNEAEDCQFFLSPEADRSFRIVLDPLVNEGGAVLSAEVMPEYYHNVKKIMTPDGLPPLAGAVAVKGGQSQGFVIQVTTKPDDAAGLYEAVLHVFDDATGKEVRSAKVAVKVWDFALSEETIMRTAFGLYYDQLVNAWPDDFNKNDLYKNAYEMLLEYRVNCLDLPGDPRAPEAAAYLSNPRVNTWRSNYYDINRTYADHPDWLKKCIFYIVDEPDSNEKISTLWQVGNNIRAVYPEFRQVSPFYCNYDLNENNTICTDGEPAWDQLCFMAHSLQIWCCKLDAFTPRNLYWMNNVSYLESPAQEQRHGTFIDRMKEEVDGGDELWAYVCCTPIQPYCNWQLDSDGIETILSFWQCKEYDVTGMLYWSVNFWNVDAKNHDSLKDPLTWPGVYWGDGMLIWGGAEFGLDRPIPTLRLVNVRDGIEDYQMLCMLEELVGREKVDDIIKLVSTSVVTYTRDDDLLHAVRILLGETLEAAALTSNK